MRSQATRIKKRHQAPGLLSKGRQAFTSVKTLLLRLHAPRLERRALLLGGSIGVATLAVSAIVSQALVPDRNADEIHTLTVSRQLELSLPGAPTPPDTPPGAGAIAHLPEAPQPASEVDLLREQTLTIRSGDSLALIFNRAGYSARQLYELVTESGEGDMLSRIYPGRDLVFRGNQSGDLLELEYRLSALESLLIQQSDEGYVAQRIQRTPERYPASRSGQIESSFYMAGKASGLTDKLIMELAGLFGWDIDFALEIRRGDSFRVIYEDLYLDGEPIGHGDILAAEFVNQGHIYRAVRHTFADGSTDYYTPDGESMRKAFLRTPLDVFRISSHFDPYRKHPVLNTIRAHNGTDYAAPTGTPIRATGAGRVTSARFSSSYGNVVEIQHGETYRTLYAHMSRFASGIRNGAKVEQGQIIGYVGMTGLATGPHLHFEFYVNDNVRNPVTVELPNGDPLTGEELKSFRNESVALIELLENPALKLADSSGDQSPRL